MECWMNKKVEGIIRPASTSIETCENTNKISIQLYHSFHQEILDLNNKKFLQKALIEKFDQQWKMLNIQELCDMNFEQISMMIDLFLCLSSISDLKNTEKSDHLNQNPQIHVHWQDKNFNMSQENNDKKSQTKSYSPVDENIFNKWNENENRENNAEQKNEISEKWQYLLKISPTDTPHTKILKERKLRNLNQISLANKKEATINKNNLTSQQLHKRKPISIITKSPLKIKSSSQLKTKNIKNKIKDHSSQFLNIKNPAEAYQDLLIYLKKSLPGVTIPSHLIKVEYQRQLKSLQKRHDEDIRQWKAKEVDL